MPTSDQLELSPELIEQLHRYQSKRRQRTWLWVGGFVISVAIMSLVLGLGYGYYRQQQLAKLIPQNIRENAIFAIYLPKPSAYTPNYNSFSYSNGVLQYGLKDSSLNAIISEQLKTPEFDLSKFSAGVGLTGAKQTTINGNQALLGSIQGRTIAIMDTGETIITIASGSATSQADLETLLRSLRKI